MLHTSHIVACLSKAVILDRQEVCGPNANGFVDENVTSVKCILRRLKAIVISLIFVNLFVVFAFYLNAEIDYVSNRDKKYKLNVHLLNKFSLPVMNDSDPADTGTTDPNTGTTFTKEYKVPLDQFMEDCVRYWMTTVTDISSAVKFGPDAVNDVCARLAKFMLQFEGIHDVLPSIVDSAEYQDAIRVIENRMNEARVYCERRNVPISIHRGPGVKRIPPNPFQWNTTGKGGRINDIDHMASIETVDGEQMLTLTATRIGEDFEVNETIWAFLYEQQDDDEYDSESGSDMDESDDEEEKEETRAEEKEEDSQRWDRNALNVEGRRGGWVSNETPPPPSPDTEESDHLTLTPLSSRSAHSTPPVMQQSEEESSVESPSPNTAYRRQLWSDTAMDVGDHSEESLMSTPSSLGSIPPSPDASEASTITAPPPPASDHGSSGKAWFDWYL
jgi:hypothetical protein